MRTGMLFGVAGLWLVLILAVVAVALAVLPRLGTTNGDDARADAILKERLAAGEIDETEYRERSAVLAAYRPPRPRGTPWPVAAAVIALVALVLLVGAVTGWPGGGRWTPMGGAMPGMQDMHGMMGARPAIDAQAPATIPDATELTVEAGDLWFRPDVVEVTVGEAVNLTVTNGGRIFHDLVIDELDFRLAVDAGEVATGGLRVDRAGEYEFYCSVPGHAAAGMGGRLSASPAPS